MPHEVEELEVYEALVEAADPTLEPGEAIERLAARADTLLVGLRAEHTDLQLELGRRWGEALDLLDLFVAGSIGAGIQHDERFGAAAKAAGNPKHPAMRRLMARACLTAREILALLRAGFGSGAVSRWRTLHELRVVAVFIARNPPDVARRYRDYQTLERYRDLRSYERSAGRLGWPQMPAAEARHIKDESQHIREEYGRGLDRSFDWAREALTETVPELKGRRARAVYAEDLEHAVGLDHMRPFARLANAGIHTDPRGASLTEPDALHGVATRASPKSLSLAGYFTPFALYDVAEAFVAGDGSESIDRAMVTLSVLGETAADTFNAVELENHAGGA